MVIIRKRQIEARLYRGRREAYTLLVGLCTDAPLFDAYDEIEAYENAKRYLDGVMNGREKLPTKEWQAEQKKLLAERYGLCENYYTLKDEIKNVETLRRSVETLMRDDLRRTKPVRERGTI